MKTILVPLDGSALAEQILSYVPLLARLLDARVLLLSVVAEQATNQLIASYAAAPTQEGDLGKKGWPWERRAWEELSQSACEYLAPRAEALRASGLDVAIDVRGGLVAERIVEVAAEERCSLIAMATHGYSGVRRWTFGSVADKVVQSAVTPIFLARGSRAAGQVAFKRILVPLDARRCRQQSAARHNHAAASGAPTDVGVAQGAVPLLPPPNDYCALSTHSYGNATHRDETGRKIGAFHWLIRRGCRYSQPWMARRGRHDSTRFGYPRVWRTPMHEQPSVPHTARTRPA